MKSSKSKKVIFENWSMCLYVGGWAWLCEEYSVLYISKIDKYRNTKFYAQISELIIFPDLGENPENGSGVEWIWNETENEYIKNGSKDFL